MAGMQTARARLKLLYYSDTYIATCIIHIAYLSTLKAQNPWESIEEMLGNLDKTNEDKIVRYRYSTKKLGILLHATLKYWDGHSIW